LPAAVVAQGGLTPVLRDTFGHFGPAQAVRYITYIRCARGRVAAGTAPSRSVCEAMALRPPADLRSVKVSGHLVLFRERNGEVQVTDVLHEAMDVVGRVGKVKRLDETLRVARLSQTRKIIMYD
jgi:plasmid stabilization system protein ParE